MHLFGVYYGLPYASDQTSLSYKYNQQCALPELVFSANPESVYRTNPFRVTRYLKR